MTAANSATPATSRSSRNEMSAKPEISVTARRSWLGVAGKPRDRLVGKDFECGWIKREIGREPGVFRKRHDMSELRAFGDPARDEVGGLQRESWRTPARRQGRKLAPPRRGARIRRPRPGEHDSFAIGILAEPVEQPPGARLVHFRKPPPTVAHGV